MKTITSRQHPIVDAFRELADAPDAEGRRLLLDGVHLVREALDASIDMELVAMSSPKVDAPGEEHDLASALREAGVEVVRVAEDVLRAMTPVRTPAGVVAVARRTARSVEDICTTTNPLVIVAIDVQDPGNVGSLIRAAEAGGATGVLVCGACASPFGWKALRGSMGSALRLPIASGVTIEAALDTIQASGLTVVAAAPRGGFTPDDIDWSAPTAVLLGGEGPGLAPAITERADVQVTIPMAGHVESLNVAVAGAILVYAARRQRVPSGEGRDTMHETHRR